MIGQGSGREEGRGDVEDWWRWAGADRAGGRAVGPWGVGVGGGGAGRAVGATQSVVDGR